MLKVPSFIKERYASTPRRPLPRFRFILFVILTLFSVVALAVSAALLNFTLVKSGTFIKSQVELVVANGFTLLCLAVALGPGRGRFFTRVWCELAWLGVAWFLVMGGTTTLNSQTPGLITHSCSQWFYCRALLVILIFSSFNLVCLTFLFFPLLIISLLQHFNKTGHARGVWMSRVDDWEGWNGGWTWESQRRERKKNDGGEEEERVEGDGKGRGRRAAASVKDDDAQSRKSSIGDITHDNPYVLEDPKMGENTLGDIPHTTGGQHSHQPSVGGAV